MSDKREKPAYFGAYIDLEYNTFSARYQGGAYIDLYNQAGNSYDVINVYDYEKGRPSIEFTVDAVRQVITDLINEEDDRVMF